MPRAAGPRLPSWGNGHATERGTKAHTSLRSIHNDVEENQPGITARK
jgi:hypothetical protein